MWAYGAKAKQPDNAGPAPRRRVRRNGRPWIAILSRTAAAAVVMICHGLLASIVVLTMWGVEHLIEYLGGGRSMLVYNTWPLEYLFQTIDVAVAATVGIFGVYETVET